MAFRKLGNCPIFEFTATIEKLDHFSSQSGTKTKDKSIPISKSGTIRIVMEELTSKNLALALGGSIGTDTAGNPVIDIMSESALSKILRFTGDNDVGINTIWDFLRVDFIPSAAISPISDEWMQFEANGEAIAVGGKFGTVTFPDVPSAGETTPLTTNYTVGKGILEIDDFV